MLKIIIKGSESFNSDTNEFIYDDDLILYLEHTLETISTWESKWHKPFISNNDKSVEEIKSYISIMSKNEIDDNVLERLNNEHILLINEYIDDSMTATTFNDFNKHRNRDIITSELIYYWMLTYNIPFECQKWHLNRLLTLIKVCNIKNSPQKKMSRNDIITRNKELNKKRRDALNTKG